VTHDARIHLTQPPHARMKTYALRRRHALVLGANEKNNFAADGVDFADGGHGEHCGDLGGSEERLLWDDAKGLEVAPEGACWVECHASGVARHASHVTRHTSHVTLHTSHVTRHASHITRHTSHVTLHTSHVTRHTSHFTRHTSHVTRHTSHVTRHTSRVTHHASPIRNVRSSKHRRYIAHGIACNRASEPLRRRRRQMQREKTAVAATTHADCGFR